MPNEPLVNYEKVKVKTPKRNNLDHDVPEIHREDHHIKNHVAFTQETTLKPSNQCPVKQSPEEKANLKADTATIRSTSTVPYDESVVSPIFDDNFVEHAFSNWPQPAAKHLHVKNNGFLPVFEIESPIFILKDSFCFIYGVKVKISNLIICILTFNLLILKFICLSSPGNLWFDRKQIATVLILPQCNSMMYLK